LTRDIKPRTVSINIDYEPRGGDKKIESRKLSWNAEPKVDSLPRNTYAPGGGKKKIESKKLQWSSKARVGSLSNINYQPKCAQKKIFHEKLDIKVSSRVGSLDNLNYKAVFEEKRLNRSDKRDVTEVLRRSQSTACISQTHLEIAKVSIEERSQTLDRRKKSKERLASASYQKQFPRKMSPNSAGV